MSTFVVVIIVCGLAACAALTALGFRPAPPLPQYQPQHQAADRSFAEPPDQVLNAYTAAARRSPGVRVAHVGGGVLYVDCRPTVRILNGDFGTLARFTVAAEASGTVVHVDGAGKTFGLSRATTLTEIERAIRMRAKASGLTEHHIRFTVA